MSFTDELRAMFDRQGELAAGGLVRSRTLADAMRDAGWVFEVRRDGPGGYPEVIAWPPHLAGSVSGSASG